MSNWRERATPETSAGSWRSRAVPENLQDAPADFQPSGQEPPSNPSFEVEGRYNTQGATPSYAPPPSPGGASGFSPTRALLTNEPTQGFGEDVVRGIPATLGGLAGTLAGAGAASIPGAALGGMAGEGLRQSAVGLRAIARGEDAPATGQVLGSMGIQGAMQGGGQAVGLGIGAAARAVRPGVNRLAAQVMRVGSAVSDKSAEAVAKNPSLMISAPNREAASEGYKAFERYTGLRGLEAELVAGNRATIGSAKLEKMVLSAANKLAQGVTPDPQELYLASQAASKLNQAAKYGEPQAQMAAASAAIQQGKGMIDDALGVIYPEYKNLRADYAASRAVDEFSSWLPQNKNQSPNVLRTVLAGRESLAAAGAIASGSMAMGSPVGLAALPLISPKFYGATLTGAAIAGKVPAPVYRVGARALTGGAGSALADAYMRQQGAR